MNWLKLFEPCTKTKFSANMKLLHENHEHKNEVVMHASSNDEIGLDSTPYK